MSKTILGIIREGKTPPDRRVPLTPAHCAALISQYEELEIIVQPSEIRGFTDAEYASVGITVQEDLSSCDIIMGVKEVPIEDLLEGKKYCFFSHTIKEQAYNRKLLQAVLQKRIQLIDYECLRYKNGLRIIGFGRYAGIVGAYNALIGYGKRKGLFDLKRANDCKDRAELNEQLQELKLPPIKIVLTGEGRVGGGAKETLDTLGVEQVGTEEFLHEAYDHPVYVQLGVLDYNKMIDGESKDEEHFFKHGSEYETAFIPYTKVSDIFISCHFWDPVAPRLFTREDILNPFFKMEVIADISCDIGGSVPTTLDASSIAEPFFGYNKQSGEKGDPFHEEHITIMSVDNLPCELPRDSSVGFADDLANDVLPYVLGNDSDNRIARASITKDGELTRDYQYLKEFAAGMQDL
ncbi:MAG: alanine dehydrogenase [Flavobacteriales bacterium]|nr:alanine dehydrogenase [Flavobacteriales bacterium]